MSLIHFEDIPVGHVFEYGSYPVMREPMIAFAQEFDPQVQHLDEKGARLTMLGQLCASGWHTAAMTMRMNCDGFLLNAASLGAGGVDEVRWTKPVLPGDFLHVRGKVVAARRSASRPEMGIVDIEFNVLNQNDEIVMVQRGPILFGCREPEEPTADAVIAKRSGGSTGFPAAPPRIAEGYSAILGYLDDIELGARLDLGSYEFTQDNVRRFAEAFDPQPFHLDEEAAQKSYFGRLAASGWHTAAAFMHCMIDTRNRVIAELTANGEPVPPRGPSPGFKNLRWYKPVYPGDVISYSSTPIEKRTTSRPGWGLLTSLGVGVNQNGVRVYEYYGSAFRPVR
jgi:acyl dehydratase